MSKESSWIAKRFSDLSATETAGHALSRATGKPIPHTRYSKLPGLEAQAGRLLVAGREDGALLPDAIAALNRACVSAGVEGIADENVRHADLFWAFIRDYLSVKWPHRFMASRPLVRSCEATFREACELLAELAADLPALTDRAVIVRDYLRDLPLGKGCAGKELCGLLDRANHNTAQNVLTSQIIPELRPWGIKNKLGAGYYFPADAPARLYK